MDPKTITTCKGANGETCEIKLVPKRVWQAATERQREIWMEVGYRRHEAGETCARHYEPVERQPGRLSDSQLAYRNRYFELWEQYKNFPDPCTEIGAELGIPRESVKKALKRSYGIEVRLPDSRALERDYMIGEIKFFLSMNQGVDYIAKKLGLEPLELARRCATWKSQGLIDFDFEDYLTDAERLILRPAREHRNRDAYNARRRTGAGVGGNRASRPNVIPTASR